MGILQGSWHNLQGKLINLFLFTRLFLFYSFFWKKISIFQPLSMSQYYNEIYLFHNIFFPRIIYNLFQYLSRLKRRGSRRHVFPPEIVFWFNTFPRTRRWCVYSFYLIFCSHYYSLKSWLVMKEAIFSGKYFLHNPGTKN